MTVESYRTLPCRQCPWRRDADLTFFTDTDMAKLANANGTSGDEAAPNSPAMSCHIDQPDTAHPMRLCAGWLAVVGRNHLGIRMALLAGNLPPDAVTPAAGWPTLHTSLDDLLAERARQQAEVHHPTVAT
ncbi:hypothetical protein Amsp01_090350 [Amycolatopsis sp. NBRC 101858]|uniref:DUF6283 family protein n=1 Tax=Amycolatopsis sp. NBRC 101858 TaxID=3032200 RepID=UPI0024A0101A|nr:DUF6283 family protein [Amycolatopsis sp. NBRC 101858]GLY43012.1 hypothetical protein Amsp01_090350 [Amycolatopsis sp. NBRC 101858]